MAADCQTRKCHLPTIKCSTGAEQLVQPDASGLSLRSAPAVAPVNSSVRPLSGLAMETIKKTGSFVAVAITTILLQLLLPLIAHTAELKVLSAVGMRQVMLELGPKFQRATGEKLQITFDASGRIAKRIEAGEPADVIMITGTALERLTKIGKVLAGSEVDLASSIAAVAVRQGAPKPDISSPEAFRRALLDAKSIARGPIPLSVAQAASTSRRCSNAWALPIKLT